MKTLATLFLLTFLLFLTAVAISGQICGPNQNSGKRDGVYYTNCYPQINGDGPTLDTNRIRRALADIHTAGSGKLVFNEPAYYVFGTLTIDSNTTLEGLGSSGESGPSVIHYIPPSCNNCVPDPNDKVLFFIGEDKHHITIRDLGFYNERGFPSNGAIAIRAAGEGSSSPSTTHIVMDNLVFKHFDTGFLAEATDPNAMGWQLDTTQLSNSEFDDCMWGVHLISDNVNMELHNVVFNSAGEKDLEVPIAGTDQTETLHHDAENGIWMERAGYVIMNYVVGNGERNGTQELAGTFVKINRHSPININNTFGEAFQKELIIDGFDGFRFSPIVVNNSAFPACRDNGTVDENDPLVLINQATVVSEGNTWSCNGVARAVIKGKSDVYSYGDRFCGDRTQANPNSNCFENGLRSGFVVRSNNAVLRSDHSTEFDDLNLPAFEVLTSGNLGARPMLSLTSSFFDSQQGSVSKAQYTFTRNSTNGRLEMAGVSPQTDPQDPPTATPNDQTGYVFKFGPVQLQSVTAKALDNYTTSSDDGSMLFCSNCQAGSTPCAGAGDGALALRVNGQWHCK
jgi:hypothetical protein